MANQNLAWKNNTKKKKKTRPKQVTFSRACVLNFAAIPRPERDLIFFFFSNSNQNHQDAFVTYGEAGKVAGPEGTK